MNRFEQCLKFVLTWEGGYVHHRFDRGGATNQGITQRTYDEWRESKDLPLQPAGFMEQSERDSIYRERYWGPVRGEQLPPPVDLVVFDSAVNCGPGTAARWLQRAVGAKPDGIVGARTLEAVGKRDALIVAYEVIRQRRGYYAKIVEQDPTQAVFAHGWENRVAALEKEMRK